MWSSTTKSYHLHHQASSSSSYVSHADHDRDCFRRDASSSCHDIDLGVESHLGLYHGLLPYDLSMGTIFQGMGAYRFHHYEAMFS